MAQWLSGQMTLCRTRSTWRSRWLPWLDCAAINASGQAHGPRHSTLATLPLHTTFIHPFVPPRITTALTATAVISCDRLHHCRGVVVVVQTLQRQCAGCTPAALGGQVLPI